jgi:hypothetical protein
MTGSEYQLCAASLRAFPSKILVLLSFTCLQDRANSNQAQATSIPDAKHNYSVTSITIKHKTSCIHFLITRIAGNKSGYNSHIKLVPLFVAVTLAYHTANQKILLPYITWYNGYL